MNAKFQHTNKIKNVYSKGLPKDIRKKTIDTLHQMKYDSFLAKEQTRELAQGFGQSITKEIGATSYDVGVEGKSVTESLFDDKKW